MPEKRHAINYGRYDYTQYGSSTLLWPNFKLKVSREDSGGRKADGTELKPRTRLASCLRPDRRIQGPDSSDGNLEGVSVGIAEVKRWRVVAKHNLSLNVHAVNLQAEAPGSHFAGLNSKRGVARTSGAMRGKLSIDLRQICSEEQQDAWSGANLESSSTASGKGRHLAKSEDIAIETDCAIQIADVERCFKDRMGRRKHESECALG
jgi:hypothetical protein